MLPGPLRIFNGAVCLVQVDFGGAFGFPEVDGDGHCAEGELHESIAFDMRVRAAMLEVVDVSPVVEVATLDYLVGCPGGTIGRQMLGLVDEE